MVEPQKIKKNGGRGQKRFWNIMEGVNLFGVCYMNLWNYHNETPYYYCMLLQK
jgi:hypothetical protein